MLMFRVKRGIRFHSADGRLWTLDRILISGRVVLVADDGHAETLGKQELLRRWHQNEWRIDSSSIRDVADTLFTATDRDLTAFTQNQRDQAERRYEAIAPLCASRHVSRAALEERRRSLVDVFPCPPSARTLQRWLERYRAGSDITALIDVQPVRRPRGCEEVQSLFERAVEEAYLAHERPRASRAFDHFELLAADLNRSRAPFERVRTMSRATFYRRLERIDVAAADRKRLGRFEANKVHRTALANARASVNLDRVELDHTQLDIILIDERTGQALGRPWLTVAICVYSKMIFGIYLTFEPPSANSVLQCLKIGVLPKDQALREFPEIQNEWPVYGVPTTIVFDNSLDAHGGRVKLFCLSVGASIQYCPSRKPWFKGAVERYMRTQNQGLLHELPGTTFSSPTQRAGYRSELMCQLGRKTFSRLLLRWIVDVYQVTPHRTTQMPPIERWKRNAAARNFDLPASPADLDLLVARSATRSLNHYGVELEGLRYNSAALQDLYREVVGGRRGSSDRALVEVRYHDDTVAHVEVLDPKEKKYLRVPAVDREYTAGLDRHTHLIVKRKLRREFGSNWRIQDRRKAMQEMQALVEEAGETKRRLSRSANRAKRDRLRLAQLVLPAPIPASAKPSPAVAKGRQAANEELPELTPIVATHLIAKDGGKR